jgi:hypothetical protein
MADAASPAACPAGHADTVKLMPLVAVGGKAGADSAAAAAPGPGAGGGCCGGACGCG